jgi:glycosyltransferase involved in cell wall biosynthesis
MVKRVLMIAFHYPPMQGSSGIQRTLKFSQYLPEFGWEPIVLTVHSRAYSSVSKDQLGEIPPHVGVYRAFGLDISRYLSMWGRYPSLLALPDRWISWWLGAVPSGLYLIKKYKPDIIWSTYPIATAHLIGLRLSRLTRIPWVADFRDPMTDVDYPSDLRTRRIYHWIERKTITHCTRAVFTTPGAIRDYEKKYAGIPGSRFRLIENGYDEANFVAAEAGLRENTVRQEVLIMLHSGIIYPSERDPVPFFEALSVLLEQGLISPGNFKVILRATAHDDYLRPLIWRYKLNEIVFLAPGIPYREALSEMLAADGLVILQASNCNHQIPAKLYEYLRAGRPILALVDPAGDTAAALINAGIDTIAPLDSKDAIIRELIRFLGMIREGSAPVASTQTVMENSRLSRTKDLSGLLDELSESREIEADHSPVS